jgi:ribosomal protein S14
MARSLTEKKYLPRQTFRTVAADGKIQDMIFPE